MNRKMAFISGISGVKRDGEMKKNMMVFWICLLLGIMSVIYAVMVHATGSGTAFFLIWIGMFCRSIPGNINISVLFQLLDNLINLSDKPL